MTEAVVTRFGPGDKIRPGGHLPAYARGVMTGVAPKFTPGDFIPTHSSDLTGRLIRFGQSPRYGFMTIASVAISLVTGWRFIFGIDGQFICSGLVAGALERSATIFDRAPSNMMPADLAKHFNIGAPADDLSRGAPPRPAKAGTQN